MDRGSGVLRAEVVVTAKAAPAKHLAAADGTVTIDGSDKVGSFWLAVDYADRFAVNRLRRRSRRLSGDR